jgi:D-alanyl-D-alanine carboxypeptidase
MQSAIHFDAELIGDELPTPWKLERVSPIYQFDLKSAATYDKKKPFTLEIAYSDKTSGYKRIFFYDNNYQSWRELPTIDSPDKKTVTAIIFLPFARVAVFSDPLIMTVGQSSWYAYKNGNFAASVDFPKGSKLRVYNLDNNKSVEVVINDFGPERDKFPNRILDLDKVAFKKIAKTGAGLVNIRIQPLYVAPDVRGRVLGVSQSGALSQPDIKAAAAIVMNEKTGEVIWEKNSAAVLPLASLSKLAAIKVFFDQRPSLNNIVTYKEQDELYNYQYCKPYESSKVEVKDGETMTIENLVYAALVGSANNAVESLVRISGISRDMFIAKMNEFAASAGATSTHFIEPTGLSQDNVSTAREYALLTGEIFKNPVIQNISITPKYKFSTINTKKLHTMSNTNNFIRDGVFAASNNLKVTGSKTGYLDKYNLMTRTHGPNGEDLVAVDFGADTKIQSLEETKELIQYGMRKIGLIKK